MDSTSPYFSKESHIQHMENVVQESLDALELCAYFENRQSPLNKFNKREELFDNAVATLQRVVPILFYGIYLVDENGLDLSLAWCDPKEYHAYLEENLEHFIDNGTVALAMRENRAVVSFSADHNYEVLLHALDTIQNTHGLIACFLQKHTTAITSWNSILLTILMRSTAYAYENFTLYKQVDKQNEKLSDTVSQLNSEIAKKEQVQEQLRQSEIIYRNIFENTGNATIIIDQGGLILLSNSQFLTLSGYSKEELEKTLSILDFFPRTTQCRSIQELLTNYEQHSQIQDQEFLFQDRKGGEHYVILSIHSLGIDNKYIISFSDISKIKQAEQELNFQAYHDNLTMLPNRAYLQDRLAYAIKKSCIQNNFNYALLFIDIDRLKIINDTMGHSAGDTMIQQAAKKLQDCIRDVDTVARFGGDEFVILLEGIQTTNECEIVINRIYKEFYSPLLVMDKELMITLSIGVYIGTQEQLSTEEVIRCADLAMYQAKQQGRNKYCYHKENVSKLEENKFRIENELNKAIQSNEIFLNYQPIINLHTGKPYGLEALTRWEHKDKGLIPPGTFIPIAEDTGLMVPLGKKILYLAFNQFRKWLDTVPEMKNLFLCLNLSVHQLLHSNIVADIQEISEQSGMPLENLHLEITESVFIDEPMYASSIIEKFKDKEIRVCIDDFGTGYSSLRYLDQFSIDLIKIDKDLVQKITIQKTSMCIVESMLTLNEKLGIQVIAEGIEEEEQLKTLQKMNCQLGQGFLFSMPLSSKEIKHWVSGSVGQWVSG